MSGCQHEKHEDIEEKPKESEKCKTCRFYNVGCHPITKEGHRNDETPDCYRPVKGGKLNDTTT